MYSICIKTILSLFIEGISVTAAAYSHFSSFPLFIIIATFETENPDMLNIKG